jgi:hypothetical protein
LLLGSYRLGLELLILNGLLVFGGLLLISKPRTRHPACSIIIVNYATTWSVDDPIPVFLYS